MDKDVRPPPHIERTLPSVDQVLTVFGESLVELDAGTLLHRAAYGSKLIFPDHVTRTHRYGPPRELRLPDGTWPFWWLYAGRDPETAVWEAGLCGNDEARPNTFYFDKYAEQIGVIAEIRLTQPATFLGLKGSALSRMGIYDQLSSPNHEWCKWFGVVLDNALLTFDERQRPHGIAYLSRKHPGFEAYALSSRALGALLPTVEMTYVKFVDHPVYEQLRDRPFRVSPPFEAC